MGYEKYVHHVEDRTIYFGQDGSESRQLGEKVKAEWIKPGMAEVGEKDGEVVFVKAIKAPENGSNNAPAPTNNPGTSYREDMENKRQRLIVRQSCLTRAFDIESKTEYEDKEVLLKNVKETAEELCKWVFE